MYIHVHTTYIPFDAFLSVLLLLQDKHVVVEELLELLVGEVDAQLLKGVELRRKKKKKKGVHYFIFCKFLRPPIVYPNHGSN